MSALLNPAHLQEEKPKRMHFELASTLADIRASQALRYRVFAGEMGAQLKGEGNLDQDHFDPYCQHLLVKDSKTGAIIASTRLLTNKQAAKAGGYYSESEFEMSQLHDLPGRVVEIGRTCVDPNYRAGAAIAVLWSGLADFITQFKIDYLFGCASIAMEDGGMQAQAIMKRVRQHAFSDDQWRVTPKVELPAIPTGAEDVLSAPLPPLLKAYLRLGARICGEAYYDADFNCADLFVLVKVDEMDSAYTRHFLDRVSNA